MKFKKAEAANAEMDMTPMIDVVFQLISFFMMILNVEQAQADERVKLPQDQLARPTATKRDHELVLNFGYHRNNDGSRVGAGDPVIFYANQVEEGVPVANFHTFLGFEKSNYINTGVDPKEVTVIIRADAEVPTGQVQELIKKCQEASFEKFSLRAKQVVNKQ
jgi:biopolymer transport protein ExbD